MWTGQLKERLEQSHSYLGLRLSQLYIGGIVIRMFDMEKCPYI